MEFPAFNSKALSDGNTYNLLDPVERQKYFKAKLGSKIEEVKTYLDTNTFVAYLLAKKQAGKGIYSKMVEEILGPDRFAHISVGDVIRDVHEEVSSVAGEKSFRQFLNANYRGFLSIDEAINAIKSRSQDKVSIPTDLLLVLLKRQITKVGRKALFIDGLPRTLDQISSSLYFRDLINYRDDPDFFVFIEVPMEVIDARMKGRVVCPECHTSRNIYFSPTTFARYDNKDAVYYFLCDNTFCTGYGKSRYVSKEGDAAGVKSIAARLEQDQDLIEKALKLQGIPKVMVKSSYPLDVLKKTVEDYEIQQIYSYAQKGTDVELISKPWIFKNDAGVECGTIYGAVYVLNLFTQIYDIVIGKKL